MPRCLHPRLFINNTSFGSPSAGYVQRDGKAVPRLRLDRVVACGKCVNCLKNKQSDFACRIVREANALGSMVFVTFTYRPDKLPFACSLYRVDRDTGELFSDYKLKLLPESSLLDGLRSQYEFSFKGREPFCETRSFCSDEVYDYFYNFTPSISRLDFRKWLKRERVCYERKHGKKLPVFSYCCIGEYGSNTARPHMHACFMGLSCKQVWEITQSWREDYGFTYIENVNCVNKDGSSGFNKAARYVAKYLFKGKMDISTVLAGEAEKGRICASVRLGNDVSRGSALSASERSYYMAEDLFGPLDWQHMCKINGLKLTDNEKRFLSQTISNRSIMCLNGVYYRLPRSIVRSLFYEVSKTLSLDGKVIRFRYKATPLRFELSFIIQSNFLRDYWKKYHDDLSYNFARQSYAGIRSMLAQIESDSAFKESIAETRFRQSYKKSIF